jgi:hypothetical protein
MCSQVSFVPDTFPSNQFFAEMYCLLLDTADIRPITFADFRMFDRDIKSARQVN